MPLTTRARETASEYGTWYYETAVWLWQNISPLGYLSICCACVFVGYFFLRNSVSGVVKT